MSHIYSIKFSIALLILLAICSCIRKANENPVLVETEKKIQVEKDNINHEYQDQTDFQYKLFEKGIDFYAQGNEPSWALDMDFEKNFQFKTMEGVEIIVSPVKVSKAMDAKVIRYYAEAEAGTLIVTIQEGKCQDSMADNIFNYSVSVQVKEPNQDDLAEYEGCGNYVTDYRLHDIWVLESLYGQDLKSTMKGMELPRFEFSAREGKILGYTGCNDFSGTYTQIGINEIQFQEVSMTKKMCPEMEVENILSKSVFGRRMNYSIENLKLKLSGFDGSEFIFKKVD